MPALLALGLVACSNNRSANPSAALESAFRSSDAGTKLHVERARDAMEKESYTEAMLTLKRVLNQGKVTPEQRQAVSTAVGHVMKAIDRNPQIDNPVLHQIMAELILKAHGEN